MGFKDVGRIPIRRADRGYKAQIWDLKTIRACACGGVFNGYKAQIWDLKYLFGLQNGGRNEVIRPKYGI